MILMIKEGSNKKMLSEYRNKNYFLVPLIMIICFTLFTGNVFGQNPADTLKPENTNKTNDKVVIKSDSVIISTSLNNMFPGNDTLVAEPPKKNPVRAGWYSAILPGLGQAYNGKYWKIPIIYSIFAGMFFIAEDNNYKYDMFKKAYLNFDDDKPSWVPSYLNKDAIKEYRNYYKRNRDLNIIIAVGLYLMNILDASVDAHLMDFDISEDLSLGIKPDYNFQFGRQKKMDNSGFGLKFVLNF
jgi:hypothetical protein